MTETNDCEGATSVSQRATMLGATTKLEAALWLVAAPVRGARKKEAWELNLARWSEDLTLRLRSCLALPQRAHFRAEPTTDSEVLTVFVMVGIHPNDVTDF